MKTLTAVLLLSLYAANLAGDEPAREPTIVMLNVRQNETWFTERQKPFSIDVGATRYVMWAYEEPDWDTVLSERKPR